jgi:hypothetical protein
MFLPAILFRTPEEVEVIYSNEDNISPEYTYSAEIVNISSTERKRWIGGLIVLLCFACENVIQIERVMASSQMP